MQLYVLGTRAESGTGTSVGDSQNNDCNPSRWLADLSGSVLERGRRLAGALVEHRRVSRCPELRTAGQCQWRRRKRHHLNETRGLPHRPPRLILRPALLPNTFHALEEPEWLLRPCQAATGEVCRPWLPRRPIFDLLTYLVPVPDLGGVGLPLFASLLIPETRLRPAVLSARASWSRRQRGDRRFLPRSH